MGFVILGILILAVVIGVIWGIRGNAKDALEDLGDVVITETLSDALESFFDD